MIDGALRMALTFVLALPVAWERERKSRAAGLRTYPLLAVGACALLLFGKASIAGDPSEQADVLYGLLTGIGFLGTGALLKRPDQVSGMATMVSIWVMGAIGAGVAYGVPVLSATLSLLSFLMLRLPPLVTRRKETSA